MMWKGFFVRDNTGKREGFGKRIRETANQSEFGFNVMFAHKLLTFYLHVPTLKTNNIETNRSRFLIIT